MALNVKRSFIINKKNRLELDKKGVGIDFGPKSIKEVIYKYKNKDTSEDDEMDISFSDKNKKDLILEEKNAKKQYHDYKDFLKEIISTHQELNDKIDWKFFTTIKPPFEDKENGPNKARALEKYENFQPNFIEKIFKFLGHKRKTLLSLDIHEQELKDIAIYEEYENIVNFSKAILEGNIDAYFQLIDDFMPFYKLIEYGCNIEFGTNDKNSIEVEAQINSRDVVPKELLKMDEDSSIIKEEMENTTYYDIVQEYACSCILKIAGEVFNLLPVEKVVIHIEDNVKDYDTKINKDMTIISIVCDRKTFAKLNLQTINPSEVLEDFICNVRHQKADGFRSVERIVHY